MSDLVERLEPCPFCGGEAELDNAAEPQFARRPTVTCKNEDCFGYMPSAYFARDAEAIAAWNRRAENPELARLRSEVERLTRERDEALDNAWPSGKRPNPVVGHTYDDFAVYGDEKSINLVRAALHEHQVMMPERIYRINEQAAKLTTLTARTREVLAPFAAARVPYDFAADDEPVSLPIPGGAYRAANTLFNELKETKE